MADNYVMKNNTGTLWHETKVSVPRKGKMIINGRERYGAILRYEDRDGNDKYELVTSLGLLHYNAPEDKMTEGTPDIGGRITWLDDEVYKCGGYANQTKSGVDYTKLLFTPYDSEGNLIYDKKEDKEKPENNKAAF